MIKISVFYETTDVFFRQLTESEINWLCFYERAIGKAGAYGIQGYGAAFVETNMRDFYNVVGLPIAKIIFLLKDALGYIMKSLVDMVFVLAKSLSY
jgi:septum formation protein